MVSGLYLDEPLLYFYLRAPRVPLPCLPLLTHFLSPAVHTHFFMSSRLDVMPGHEKFILRAGRLSLFYASSMLAPSPLVLFILSFFFFDFLLAFYDGLSAPSRLGFFLGGESCLFEYEFFFSLP
ncbi:hypothetical protein BKA62DRAFT_315251 [Auriculariales sp. MPI-PUGE-AT-0066]|nr:hypothetical protein BKA62DRAFT_315251 [Auriculariales sp. MPI-PUGE-AT-0066]